MQLFALRESKNIGKALAGVLEMSLSPLEIREFEDGEHKGRQLRSEREEEQAARESARLSGGGASP